MLVRCKDDSNRPNEIPLSKWVIKDNTYTVIQVDHINMVPGQYGFKLEELNIDDCFPYQYFDSRRFDLIVKEVLEGVNAEEELALV